MKQLIFFNSLLFTLITLSTGILGYRKDAIQSSKFNVALTSIVQPIIHTSSITPFIGETSGGDFISFLTATRKQVLSAGQLQLTQICRIDIQSLIKQDFIIPLIIACCIIALKIVHYRKQFADKNIRCWFYFGHVDIMLSSSDARRNAKVTQNALSLILLVNLSLLFIASLYIIL